MYYFTWYNRHFLYFNNAVKHQSICLLVQNLLAKVVFDSLFVVHLQNSTKITLLNQPIYRHRIRLAPNQLVHRHKARDILSRNR